MKKLTLIYLGQTGAGPVYSLEMAKALVETKECQLQCIISRNVTNLEEWKKDLGNKGVRLEIVETYKHNRLSFAISLLEFWKVSRIVKAIKEYNPDTVYSPFLLTWDFLIYPRYIKT